MESKEMYFTERVNFTEV